jgi:hypothetical protein
MRLNCRWLIWSFIQPPVVHAEIFGKFLAHFESEDALGSAVVCLERGSGDGLGVAEFVEGSMHWASMFAAHILDASGFGFCC